MSVAELIDRLAGRGLTLWFEGQQLRFRGPRDVLIEADRERLRGSRAEVLTELRRRAANAPVQAPLSREQQRLCQQARAGRATAARTFAAHVGPGLDVVALRNALQAVVDRHGVLRMRVQADGQAPSVSITGSVAVELSVHDSRSLTDAAMRQQIDDTVGRPFDLQHDLPWRLSLHARAADEHVLLLTVHPIAADAPSMCQLVDELCQFYAEASGAPCTLPGRIEASFAEFVAAEAAPATASPTASTEPTASGERIHIETELPQVVADRLVRLSGDTFNAVLATAWADLWQRGDSEHVPTLGVLLPGGRIGRFARTIGPFATLQALPPHRDATTRQLDLSCAADVPAPVEQFLHGRDPQRLLPLGAVPLRPWPLSAPTDAPPLRLQVVRCEPSRIQCRWSGLDTLCSRESLAELADDLAAALQRGLAQVEAVAPAAPPPVDEPLSDLLARLQALGIRLSLDDGRLRVNAPKGVLDDELKGIVSRRKAEIVETLRTTTSVNDNARSKDDPSGIARVERRGHLPVSHTQQRLWFLKQLDPGNAAHNIPFAVRMNGVLDERALEQTLAELIQRHESLRTRFLSVDGTPRCVIEPSAALEIERIDLGAVPAAQRDDAMWRRVQALVATPFDISRAPLLRTALIRMDARSHVLCFVHDHIVSDGVSTGIFLLDFRALYAQHAAGEPARLPELAVQYVDYGEWQRHAFAEGSLARHLEYWKRQLADLPAALQLPTDRPRPPVQTYRGARLIRQFPAALATQSRALARSAGATQFMVLLAAFQVLLHRYTGTADIPVGSVVANRSHAAMERVIGFFANNIVLRGDLSGRPTVRELLQRVRELCLQGMSHQEMPFDMLVDALATRREIDHSPLFQVQFVLQSVMLTRLELPQLDCEPLELGSDTSRFDLSVDVFEMPDGMRVLFEFNTDLFDTPTMARMMGHYRSLLEDFVARPEAHIDELTLLTAAEAQRMPAYWRNSAADAAAPAAAAGQTLHGLFEAQAEATPDAVAVRFQDTALSYRELDTRANRLAHRLRELGVGAESLVGVWMDRSADMVVALLGVLKSGAAYVPLDPAFPADRIDFMMSDAALPVVVTQARLAQTLGSAGPRAVCMDSDAALLAQQPAHRPSASTDARQLAYVIYTSGSTGRPKGVELEHRSVVNFLRSMQREPGLTASDRFVSVTTLSFDIAGLEIFGPLTVGGTVILASRSTALDAAQLAALLRDSGATILQATPATWRMLLESGWRGLPQLKMLCGGEALPRELAERLLALGGELWNMYGPTETTIWSTVSRVTDATRTAPIGRPIANTTVYVLEPSGLPAPIGIAGELCIGGAGLARGYRNRPELTAEKFVELALPDGALGQRRERVYRTGDMARFLADGQLEFLGRRDQQVKLRGFRIELGEIESVLANHASVQQVVVSVREDTPGDQRLVAYVVAAPNTVFDEDAARTHLRVQLPDYMIPQFFVTLETLPLTPNGKIDRKALPRPQSLAGPADRTLDATMNPTQRRMADVWRDVLQRDQVGLHANFFDMGGHSLLLVKLQAAIQREFSVDLTLVELFQRTTIAAQTQRVTATAPDDSALRRAQARIARQLHV